MHGVLIGAILVLSLLGMPIGYALGSATLLALLYSGSFPLILIPQQFPGSIPFPSWPSPSSFWRAT